MTLRVRLVAVACLLLAGLPGCGEELPGPFPRRRRRRLPRS